MTARQSRKGGDNGTQTNSPGRRHNLDSCPAGCVRSRRTRPIIRGGHRALWHGVGAHLPNGDTPIEGTQITLSFWEGSLEGSGGCNIYGGGYTASEDSLHMSDLYWTEMACLEPEGILDQELAYLNALNAVASYRVDAGRLQLYDGAGTQVLVFGPQETARPASTSTSGPTDPPLPGEAGLIASIEAPESLASGEAVPVKFTLTNTLSEGLYVLRWFTPLEGLAGDIFRVRRDGLHLPYHGILVKRAPPTAEDYVWLDAGGFDLGRG